jgi:ubiquinone/menaquinone biosynthesis C-methylase UbiE
MASVKDNLNWWGGSYDWSKDGDEWSKAWGGTDALWRFTLLPRMGRFLPAASILEIAPGYGRFTQYLIQSSKRFVGVDLAPSCVAFCVDRFKAAAHAAFFSNDGKSLPMVKSGSVDFVFSFDSLVHVEAAEMETYAQEIARVLKPDGAAFLHHSNLDAYASDLKTSSGIENAAKVIPVAGKMLKRAGVTQWHQSRAPSMSAEKMVRYADAAGLACIAQELLAWPHSTSQRLTDCISILAPKGSVLARENVVSENPMFGAEAASARAVAKTYALG